MAIRVDGEPLPGNVLGGITAGRTVLFTSHVLSEVEEIGSSLAVLDRGAIRFHGSAAELCARYGDANLEQAFVKCVRPTIPAASRRAHPAP